MTPDEVRRQWYAEQAEEFITIYALGWIESAEDEADVDIAYDFARLAAHFGRLALGEDDDVDQWIQIAAQNAVDAKAREAILLAERDALTAQLEAVQAERSDGQKGRDAALEVMRVAGHLDWEES